MQAPSVAQQFSTIALLISLVLCTTLCGETPLTEENRTALEIGKAVMTVDRALEFKLSEPPTAEELAKLDELTKEVVRIGQITRLYPWVVARIDLEITLAKSFIRDTRPDEIRTRQLNARIKHLQRTRLLIDAPH